ncbi:MAG: hypothetical protein ACK5BQ_03380 [Ignavibacteria bacterium]|jgi:hypothetical protein
MKKLMIMFGLLLTLLSGSLTACPACKDSFGANGANASVGDAYSWSVLFMLSVPLTILTVAIVLVARKIRQNPNSAPTM